MEQLSKAVLIAVIFLCPVFLKSYASSLVTVENLSACSAVSLWMNDYERNRGSLTPDVRNSRLEKYATAQSIAIFVNAEKGVHSKQTFRTVKDSMEAIVLKRSSDPAWMRTFAGLCDEVIMKQGIQQIDRSIKVEKVSFDQLRKLLLKQIQKELGL